jgi:hypothetical protein
LQSKAVQEVLDRSREKLTRQVAADAQQQQMERWNILRETQTKIFRDHAVWVLYGKSP